ncbi:MAG TPA: DinB family protein [Bacteroidia bacterium]|nr:DinB family protein [Bacteroidia bacterium]
MKMEIAFYLDGLKRNAESFRSMLNGVPAGWKSSPGKWSLLEIVCHLRDEEKEDFRARLQSVLEDPSKAFSPIDPQGWVLSRRYGEQKFDEAAEAFFREREASLAWLASLKNPAWENTYLHPAIGPMSAKFILSNWLAHDYLHMRQIMKLKYDYLGFCSEENLGYAGEW